MSEEENDREEMSSNSDIDELREVARVLPEIFSALNDSIPRLISGLIGSVYSPESATNMASAIGKFYNGLIGEGIPADMALDITKKFVGALDFGRIINMVSDETNTGRLKREKEPQD